MALTLGNLTANVVRDASISKQYTLEGLLSYAQIDTVYVVTGLAAAGITSANAQSAVENFLKAVVPIGTPNANDVQCAARYYNIRSVDSDDAATGVVSYVFNTPGGDTTEWTVESDSYTEVEETDVQYDPSDPTQTALIPIGVNNYILNWGSFQTSSGSYNPRPLALNPAAFGDDVDSIPEPPLPTAYARVSVPKFLKVVRYSRTLYSAADAVAFDNASVNYIGRLNSVTFTGLTTGAVVQNFAWAPQTVFCSRANLVVSPFSGRRTCYVELIYKPQGWQPWAHWTSEHFGTPANLWRAGTIGGTPYQANGVVRTTSIATADLNGLLGLIAGGPVLPFGGNPLPVT